MIFITHFLNLNMFYIQPYGPLPPENVLVHILCVCIKSLGSIYIILFIGYMVIMYYRSPVLVSVLLH